MKNWWQPWRERSLRVLAACVLVLGVVFMPAEIYPGDPLTMREETRAILLHGVLAVEDAVANHYRMTSDIGQYVVDNPRDNRLYSKYGSMAAWMYLVPMGAELLIEGELPIFVSPRRVVYLNAFNIALAVLVAASLYRTARRLESPPGTSALFVGLCFYTTYMWNYLRAQNSEIMQSLFFSWAVTGFLDVLDERRSGRQGWGVLRMWGACTTLLLTKVSYIFVGPLFALGLLIDRKRQGKDTWRTVTGVEAARHVVPCALMVGCWATLNWIKFGSPLLTGYHLWQPHFAGLDGHLLVALQGLAFSPQWSFAACFPVLVIAIPVMPSWLRSKRVEYGTIMGIGVFYLILIGMVPNWTGAWCYGPRYWLFILPIVSLPAITVLGWLVRGTPVALLVGAVIVAGLGYSTWLQTQVNYFPFFAVQRLSGPLDGFALPAARSFFTRNTYGWIEYSMWCNRRQLDRLPWWREFTTTVDAERVARYEREVETILGSSNLFLFPTLGE